MEIDTTNLDKFQWSTSSTLTQIKVNKEGTYSIQVEKEGCTNTDSIYITINQKPNIPFSNDTVLCEGNSFIAPPVPMQIEIELLDLNFMPFSKIESTGTFLIKTTQNGCSNYDSIYVQFEDCTVELELPNIFTPNNDGKNDFFTPIFIKNIQSMETFIYNRWGKLIYETDELLINWYGEDNNNGVYYYVIHFEDSFGSLGINKGWIHLNR